MRPAAKNILFFLLLLCAGALPAVPLVFPSCGFLAFLFHIPYCVFLFSAVSANKRKYAGVFVLRGFFMMFGFYLAVFHWFFAMYPLEFIGTFSAAEAVFMVIFCQVGLSLLESLFFLPGFIFLGFLFCRITGLTKNRLMFPPLLAAVYAVSEWLQNFTFAGVPWGTLAVGQIGNPLFRMTVSLFGTQFPSFVLLLVNGYLAIFSMAAAKRLQTERMSRPFFFRLTRDRHAATALFLALTVLLSSHVMGGAALLAVPEEKESDTLSVALIQTGVSGLEINNYTAYEIYKIGEELVYKAKTEGADIALWSESVFLVSFPDGYISYYISELAGSLSMPQIVGAFRDDTESGAHYNSLYYFDKNGKMSTIVYDKRHLVPFGEYLPMENFFTAVAPSLVELMRDKPLSAGSDGTVFGTDGFGTPGALICFDSIYPYLTRETVKAGADYILLPTNDSWFLGSAALRQHEAQAVLRAVESGRDVARSAATGYSSVITARGDVYGRTDVDVAAVSVVQLTRRTHTTLAVRLGDAPIYLLTAVLAASYGTAVFLSVKRRREKTQGI